jgi:hypothetical protein
MEKTLPGPICTEGQQDKQYGLATDDPDRYDALATVEINLEHYNNAIELETSAIKLDSTQSIFLQNR